MAGSVHTLMIPAAHAGMAVSVGARAAAQTANDTATTTALAASAQASPGVGDSADGSGFSFSDLLDIVNPLQHLPVVGTLYRALTGDKIGDVEQVAGDALYGGLIGLGGSIANLIFKDITGKDVGDTVMAWLDGSDGDAPDTAVAQNAAAPGQKPGTIAPVAPASLANAALTAQALDTQAPTVLASASPQPASVRPAQATSLLADPSAFMAALRAKGIDPALGMRAMVAYERSLGLTARTTAAAQP